MVDLSFALLGGVGVFGVLGIVLGPFNFATAVAIINVLRDAQPSSGRGARRTTIAPRP
jgi:predicted PurR-regulated permease PerM